MRACDASAESACFFRMGNVSTFTPKVRMITDHPYEYGTPAFSRLAWMKARVVSRLSAKGLMKSPPSWRALGSSSRASGGADVVGAARSRRRRWWERASAMVGASDRGKAAGGLRGRWARWGRR